MFNITVIRQQAEVEAVKRGAKRAEEKANSGWFGGWFGGGKKKDEQKTKGEVEQIREFLACHLQNCLFQKYSFGTFSIKQ